MNNYTVTAGQALTSVVAESPEQAATLAEHRIKEILVAHLNSGDDDYPTELVVHDERTGDDKIFVL